MLDLAGVIGPDGLVGRRAVPEDGQYPPGDHAVRRIAVRGALVGKSLGEFLCVRHGMNLATWLASGKQRVTKTG